MTEFGREYFEEIRSELAAHDPAILEFDIDDPNVQFAFIVLHGINSGEDVELNLPGDDGSCSEVLWVDNYGEDEDGTLLLNIRSGRPDGSMSPDAANIASAILTDSIEKEINQLTD